MTVFEGKNLEEGPECEEPIDYSTLDKTHESISSIPVVGDTNTLVRPVFQ